LFTGSHLLNVQKPASKWYIVEQFIRMIVQRSCSVPQEQGREFALITQSGSETKQQLGFPNTQCRTTVWWLYEQILPIYTYIYIEILLIWYIRNIVISAHKIFASWCIGRAQHNSPGNWARKLYKPWKMWQVFQFTFEKIRKFWISFFCEWHRKL